MRGLERLLAFAAFGVGVCACGCLKRCRRWGERSGVAGWLWLFVLAGSLAPALLGTAVRCLLCLGFSVRVLVPGWPVASVYRGTIWRSAPSGRLAVVLAWPLCEWLWFLGYLWFCGCCWSWWRWCGLVCWGPRWCAWMWCASRCAFSVGVVVEQLFGCCCVWDALWWPVGVVCGAMLGVAGCAVFRWHAWLRLGSRGACVRTGAQRCTTA